MLKSHLETIIPCHTPPSILELNEDEQEHLFALIHKGGRCQGSCRKLFDAQAAHLAGAFCSFVVCGLRFTCAIGVQLRVLPDQRLGLA